MINFQLDNNVEDLRKELTDNINENIERYNTKWQINLDIVLNSHCFRFEKVQQQQEEEYGKLCLQVFIHNAKLNFELSVRSHNALVQF